MHILLTNTFLRGEGEPYGPLPHIRPLGNISRIQNFDIVCKNSFSHMAPIRNIFEKPPPPGRTNQFHVSWWEK